VLGSTSGAGQYGATLTVTVNNVSALQRFYVKVAGAETTSLGSGEYALGLNFGTGAMPTVTPPDTEILNGNPLSAGGGTPERPGTEAGPAGGVGDVFDPKEGVDLPAAAKAPGAPAAAPRPADGPTATPSAPSFTFPVGLGNGGPAGSPAVVSSTPSGPLTSGRYSGNVPAALSQQSVRPTTPAAEGNGSPQFIPAQPAEQLERTNPETNAGPRNQLVIPDTSSETEAAMPLTAGEWDLATSAYFEEAMAVAGRDNDPTPASASDEAGAGGQSRAAAAAVLVLALGGYWGRATDEVRGARAAAGRARPF
jgi:hypothetical protein